jgi:nitrous oxidase accessory protein
LRITFQFFFLLVFSVVAKANTIEVGKNKTYTHIKTALAASKNGDSLIIHSGFYKEGNIVINKSISLIGIGLPIIDGDRKFEVITVKANHVLIKGLKIQHSGYATLDDPGGVKIQEANNVSIIQNVLYDNFFGVYIQYSNNCIVKNNTIVAFGKEEQEIGNGIHAWKSDSLQIIGNNIKGHRDGIYFEFVTHSIIWRNIAVKNIRYGLHFMFSNNDAYITNIFKGNGSGVAVMFSNHVTMINNKFEENWGDAAYGLLLKEISDGYVVGNIFQENTSGIFMEGTNRILAEKNTFQKNGWAMQIQASCMENTIQKNNFISNTFDISTNGNVVLNLIQNNYWDKYEGYDLNKDGIGDIPYRPLSMFSVIVEKNPSSMLLFRSLMVTLLDKSEKIFPTLTPENFMDTQPQMKQHRL